MIASATCATGCGYHDRALKHATSQPFASIALQCKDFSQASGGMSEAVPLRLPASSKIAGSFFAANVAIQFIFISATVKIAFLSRSIS
jgi:hypothetical protein